MCFFFVHSEFYSYHYNQAMSSITCFFSHSHPLHTTGFIFFSQHLNLMSPTILFLTLSLCQYSFPWRLYQFPKLQASSWFPNLYIHFRVSEPSMLVPGYSHLHISFGEHTQQVIKSLLPPVLLPPNIITSSLPHTLPPPTLSYAAWGYAPLYSSQYQAQVDTQ